MTWVRLLWRTHSVLEVARVEKLIALVVFAPKVVLCLPKNVALRRALLGDLGTNVTYSAVVGPNQWFCVSASRACWWAD